MMKKIYIASVSMGKDSLAMLLQLIQRGYPVDVVLFYDGGMEFQCIYRNRDKVKELCVQHGIQFVELKPKEPFLFSMLERKVQNRDGSGYHYGYSWCGGACRWATRHKLNAIREWKKAQPGIDFIDYVGIAADEPKRLEKEKRQDKVFPLVEWGWTEAMCLDYCRQNGWHWLEQTPRTQTGFIDLYDLLVRVSCYCCSDKREQELFNIWYYLPQYWNLLIALQEHTDRPMKGFYKGKARTVHYLEREFQSRCMNTHTSEPCNPHT